MMLTGLIRSFFHSDNRAVASRPWTLSVRSILVLAGVLAAGAAIPKDARAQELEAIYRHASSGLGSVNSYIVDTGSGLILIDAQRTLSEGRALADTIKALEKPLNAVILTQAQPEKYGGLIVIADAFPDALIYATEAATRDMAFDPAGLMTSVQIAFPEDAAAHIPLPNRRLLDGDVLTFDGIRFEIYKIGSGEAEDMIIVHLPQANRLFTGDLVSPGFVSYMGLGSTGRWLGQLSRLNDAFRDAAPMVYPGHGLPTPFAEAVREEMGELLLTRHVVARHLRRSKLSEDSLPRIRSDLRALHAGYPTASIATDPFGINIRAVAKETGYAD